MALFHLIRNGSPVASLEAESKAEAQVRFGPRAGNTYVVSDLSWRLGTPTLTPYTPPKRKPVHPNRLPRTRERVTTGVTSQKHRDANIRRGLARRAAKPQHLASLPSLVL